MAANSIPQLQLGHRCFAAACSPLPAQRAEQNPHIGFAVAWVAKTNVRIDAVAIASSHPLPANVAGAQQVCYYLSRSSLGDPHRITQDECSGAGVASNMA